MLRVQHLCWSAKLSHLLVFPTIISFYFKIFGSFYGSSVIDKSSDCLKILLKGSDIWLKLTFVPFLESRELISNGILASSEGNIYFILFSLVYYMSGWSIFVKGEAVLYSLPHNYSGLLS